MTILFPCTLKRDPKWSICRLPDFKSRINGVINCIHTRINRIVYSKPNAGTETYLMSEPLKDRHATQDGHVKCVRKVDN